MKRVLISVAAIGALAATAFAQGRDMHGRDGARQDSEHFRSGRPGRPAMSPADREAFLDARIAGLRAGLKLTPDQDKLWPPVEEAMRGLAKQRVEAREARRERWASFREGKEAPNMPEQLRFMADRQSASADALRKLADASAPLYATLDESQRGRLAMLTRWMNPGRHMHGPRDGMMRRGALDGNDRDFAEMDGFGPRGRFQ